MQGSADSRPAKVAAPDLIRVVIQANRPMTEGEHDGQPALSLAEAVAAVTGTSTRRSLAHLRLPAGMNEPFLPFRLVIMWIASRDPDLAQETWDQSSSLRRAITIDRDGCEALLELTRALQGGKLKASGIDREGRRRAIAPEEWLDLVPGMVGSADVLVSRASTRTVLFGQALLESEVVQRLWRRDGASARQSSAKISDEQDARRTLVRLMTAQPDAPISKRKLLKRPDFQETPKRMFERAFRAAVAEAGAPRWSAAGRRPRRAGSPETTGAASGPARSQRR